MESGMAEETAQNNVEVAVRLALGRTTRTPVLNKLGAIISGAAASGRSLVRNLKPQFWAKTKPPQNPHRNASGPQRAPGKPWAPCGYTTNKKKKKKG